MVQNHQSLVNTNYVTSFTLEKSRCHNNHKQNIKLGAGKWKVTFSITYFVEKFPYNLGAFTLFILHTLQKEQKLKTFLWYCQHTPIVQYLVGLLFPDNRLIEPHLVFMNMTSFHLVHSSCSYSSFYFDKTTTRVTCHVRITNYILQLLIFNTNI